MRKGDLDGAIGCFREAARLDPRDAKAKQVLALALKLRDRRNAAVTEAFGLSLPRPGRRERPDRL